MLGVVCLALCFWRVVVGVVLLACVWRCACGVLCLALCVWRRAFGNGFLALGFLDFGFWLWAFGPWWFFDIFVSLKETLILQEHHEHVVFGVVFSRNETLMSQ